MTNPLLQIPTLGRPAELFFNSVLNNSPMSIPAIQFSLDDTQADPSRDI